MCVCTCIIDGGGSILLYSNNVVIPIISSFSLKIMALSLYEIECKLLNYSPLGTCVPMIY